MNLGIKIIVVPILLILGFPFVFFSWLLIRIELSEIRYGNIEKAKISSITPTNYQGGLSEFGGETEYKLKVGDKKIYSSYLNNPNSAFENKIWTEFISDSNIGDTVQIKILSKTQAKILKWKHLTIHKPINYWDKFWKWVLIIFLFSLASFIYYKTYKIIIK